MQEHKASHQPLSLTSPVFQLMQAHCITLCNYTCLRRAPSTPPPSPKRQTKAATYPGGSEVALGCESLVWCSGKRFPFCFVTPENLHRKSKSPALAFMQSIHGHEARWDRAAATSSPHSAALELLHFFLHSPTCRKRLPAYARNLSQMFFAAHLHLSVLSIATLQLNGVTFSR